KQGWLVTNTRFTDDAINYGRCIGVTLLSWDYPKNNGLKANIDSMALYPVTALTTLTKKEKHLSMDDNIIFVKELKHRKKTMQKIGIAELRMQRVLNEVEKLCHL